MFPFCKGNTSKEKKHLNLLCDCDKLSYVQND